MKNENSLTIGVVKEKKTDIIVLLPKIAAVFALAFGFSVMFGKAFGLGTDAAVFGFLSGTEAAFCLLLSQKKATENFPVFFAAAFFAAVFAFPEARNGTAALANKILEFLTAATGEIYFKFEYGENANRNLSFFLISSAFSGFIGTAANRKNAVLVLPTLILSTAGLLCGFLSTDLYFLIFAAGAFFGFIFVFLPENSFEAKAKNIAPSFAPAILCGLLCAVLMIFIPSDMGESIRKTAEETAHEIFYDSKTNAMPEGNLENLGAFNKNSAAALEITMETPQKIYLKGFVGEIYTGCGWEELPNEILAEYSEDFYILHKDGFFGQNSVSGALSALGEAKSSRMSIKNISACSKRAYLPYALYAAVLNSSAIGDANTKALGKEYPVDYIPGGLLEWYSAQVELSKKQESDSAVSEHLAKEYIYRRFVKENYLSVPEKAYAAVDRIFEDSKASTATEIIAEILLYFEENTEYDETTATRNGDEDFAAYFLEKSARGYSVHYATAATLMLRYFGIPARYVEGYFLSAEEAEEYQSGEKVILTESHAHAWTEYYLEGVGWVPFEVTPGYMDGELEKAAFHTSGKTANRQEQSELPETNVEQDRPKDEITEAKKNYSTVIFVLKGVAFAAVAVVFFFVLAMRRRLKKALFEISSADNRNGAAMRFGYAKKLIENADLSEETLEKAGYEEAFAVNREALFSEHEITDEQRKSVDDYAEKILAECKKEWSPWQKFKNRWIKFIY